MNSVNPAALPAIDLYRAWQALRLEQPRLRARLPYWVSVRLN